MPGETNNEKCSYLVHRNPLRFYENDPSFTKTAADGAQGGQPVNLYVIDMLVVFHSYPMHQFNLSQFSSQVAFTCN